MVIRSQKLREDTLQQLLEWERKQDSRTSIDTGSTYVPTVVDEKSRTPSHVSSSTGPVRSELYSMKALEKALTTNVKPLLRFSALKDFSGENISFLKHVQDWKRNWATAATTISSVQRSAPSEAGPQFIYLSRAKPQPSSPNIPPPPPTPALVEPSPETVLRRSQFSLALEIYLTFICPQTSDFPINISYAQLRVLSSIFSDAAAMLQLHLEPSSSVEGKNPATPFEDALPAPPGDWEGDVEKYTAAAAAGGGGDGKDAISIASTAVVHNGRLFEETTNRRASSLTDNLDGHLLPLKTGVVVTEIDDGGKEKVKGLELLPHFEIPESFGPGVFDDAERAIKYIVLTNTWPRFVGEALALGGMAREGIKGDSGGGYGKVSEGGGRGDRGRGGKKNGDGWWGMCLWS